MNFIFALHGQMSSLLTFNPYSHSLHVQLSRNLLLGDFSKFEN